jgi:hypothetical protein
LSGGRCTGAVAVAVTLTAAAAFARLFIVALGRGLLCRRRCLLRWRGAPIRSASTAAFVIAFFAALTAFFVVVRGGRFCPRGLCNLKGFTWKRLPVGHRREGDGTEGGEGNSGDDEIAAHEFGLAPLWLAQRYEKCC